MSLLKGDINKISIFKCFYVILLHLSSYQAITIIQHFDFTISHFRTMGITHLILSVYPSHGWKLLAIKLPNRPLSHKNHWFYDENSLSLYQKINEFVFKTQ